MTYGYNILLNFQKELYDFYEWNKSDSIIHIKKIPLFKIKNNDFKQIKTNIVKFDEEFKKNIFNKTEKLNKNKLPYAFLISNGKETIGIKLNKNGINDFKSSLLLDEEEEISKIADNLKITELKYKIIKNTNYNNFQTRNETEKIQTTLKKITKLYKNKEKEKLKFLCLECFEKEEDNILKIYNLLKKEIIKNKTNCNKIYSFFKIIEQK